MKNTYRLLYFVSLCPLIFPTTIHGYANDGLDGGPHRKINQFALEDFMAKAKQDPILSRYDFTPTAAGYALPALATGETREDKPFTIEYDALTRSGAWAKEDKIKTYTGLPTIDWGDYSEEGKRRGPFRWWIIEGGYSADEPEAYMALRHFYDPTNAATPYLTDLIGKPLTPIQKEYLDRVGIEPTRVIIQQGQHISLMGENPRVNARDWALYGSRHALQDVTKSMAATQGVALSTQPPVAKEESFGQAWRSIGESMHLLADMTVPAHVRNDGHPGKSGRLTNIAALFSSQYDLKSDPYEDYVTGEVVQRHAQGPVEADIAKAIREAGTPRDLFDRVALHTNANFTSEDTLSGRDPQGNEIFPHNGQPTYPAPKLAASQFELLGQDTTAYYYLDDSIGSVCLAAAVRADTLLTKRRRVFMDPKCADSQAARLIPLAIAADERLLELIIPRVAIMVDGIDAKNKTLKCRAVHYDADKKGSYDAKSPIPSEGMPTTRDRALIKLTVAGTSKYFWQKIASIQGSDFEVGLENIPSIQLDAFLNRDPASPPSSELKLAAGLDMGGIAVWSQDWSPAAIAINPDEVDMDVTSAASFKAETIGIKGKPVVWSVREKDGGVIQQDGTYASPEKPGVYHVEASLKDDPSVRADAVVRVEVKEAAPVAAPKLAKDDRGWKKVLESLRLPSFNQLTAEQKAVGARLYGLSWEDNRWYKTYKEGTWYHVLPDGRQIMGPWWVRLEIKYPYISMDWDYYGKGRISGGLYPQAKASVEAALKRSPDAKPAGTGDVSFLRVDPEGGTDIEAWRGPFKVSFRVKAYNKEGLAAGPNGPVYYSLSPQSKAQIEAVIKAAGPEETQLAVEMAGRMLAALDEWYLTPISDGPGFKGLQYPVCDGYSLQSSELPAGLELTRPGTYDGKECFGTLEDYSDSFVLTETGSADNPSKEPNTYDVRWRMIGIMAAEESSTGSVAKAAEWFQGELRQFSIGSPPALAQPHLISLAGADEAYESKANPESRDNNRWNHSIAFRKSDVVVVVSGHYYSPDYAPQSTYVQKLAQLMLKKLSPGKSAPVQPAPAPKTPVQSATSTEESGKSDTNKNAQDDSSTREPQPKNDIDIEKALQMFRRQ